MPINSSQYCANSFWPELGPEFYDPVKPALFPQATLRYRNQPWAERVGLGELTSEEWQNHFWAFEPLPDNLPEPLALRYHGHQFMHYNPDLGDGRGFLFAQLKDQTPGTKKTNLDLGTKGSGQTPWSRRGDGRLTLKGAVREILATEMLEALGVNTSKTFSVFETGEALERGDEPSPTRSAVLVRLNHSHVRIGMFQRWAYLDDKENLQKFFAFTLRHYYPDLDPQHPDVIEHFLMSVAKRLAATTAQWMVGGFVHGVLNTDNINITGESFDYGPYRFLHHYDAEFTAAYFDRSGLYAYGQQPRIMMWNLDQLRRSLQVLKPEATLEKPLQVFQESFRRDTAENLLRRLNLKALTDADGARASENLLSAWATFMDASRVPFEHFFFDWNGGAAASARAMKNARADFYRGLEFEAFAKEFKNFEVKSQDLFLDSYFNELEPVHLYIDEIEGLWRPIAEHDDWSAFEQKINRIQTVKKLFLKF